jgi:hypothetical protein
VLAGQNDVLQLMPAAADHHHFDLTPRQPSQSNCQLLDTMFSMPRRVVTEYNDRITAAHCAMN